MIQEIKSDHSLKVWTLKTHLIFAWLFKNIRWIGMAPHYILFNLIFWPNIFIFISYFLPTSTFLLHYRAVHVFQNTLCSFLYPCLHMPILLSLSSTLSNSVWQISTYPLKLSSNINLPHTFFPSPPLPSTCIYLVIFKVWFCDILYVIITFTLFSNYLLMCFVLH